MGEKQDDLEQLEEEYKQETIQLKELDEKLEVRTIEYHRTYSGTPLIRTPEMLPLRKVQISPLKCGHPSNKDTFTGPKGGQFRGVPLYIYICLCPDLRSLVAKYDHIKLFCLDPDYRV